MNLDEFQEEVLNYSIEDFFNSSYFTDLVNLDMEQKFDCYFDCDGVLFDTITVSFQEMNEILKETGIILKPNNPYETGE